MLVIVYFVSPLKLPCLKKKKKNISKKLQLYSGFSVKENPKPCFLLVLKKMNST